MFTGTANLSPQTQPNALLYEILSKFRTTIREMEVNKVHELQFTDEN